MEMDTASSADLGRRLQVRYVCDMLAHCVGPGSPPVLASVVDLSRSGVGLVVDEPFERGSIIALELPRTDGFVHACVLHAAPTSDGAWKMGCRFAEALSREDVQSLWQVTPDRRTSERHLCELRATYDDGEHDGIGTVIDIATRGLCLLLEKPLQVGTKVRLQVQESELDMAACVVRASRRRDGLWVCGCSFTYELTDAQIHQLIEQRE